MGEVREVNIRKVGKFDSDFIFSMEIKVKAIYTDIYKSKKCEAIVSFLKGRDISVVQGDKLLIDIGDVTLASILFSQIVEDYVKIKTPDKSKIKSDIKKGRNLNVGESLTLDIFKNQIRIRKG